MHGRCDRVFPCSSCIRRGCANLCPNGTLEKGKRGFLKRLEQSLPSAYPKPGGEIEHSEVAMFVARDSAMAKRIQELEAALAAYVVSLFRSGPIHLLTRLQSWYHHTGANAQRNGIAAGERGAGKAAAHVVDVRPWNCRLDFADGERVVD